LITPDTALVACRLLHDTALIFLWGAAGFLALLVPQPLAGRVWRILRPSPAIAMVAVVATTAASLPLEAGIIGDGWSDAFTPGTIRDILLDSTVGQAWQAQAFASVLLGAAFLAPARWRERSIALAAGFGLAALSLSGHASMHQGWLRAVHRLNDIVHVLAGGGWLGALVPLIPILRLLRQPQMRAEAVVALRRFSTIGHGAVALVLISGIVNTLLILGHLPTDWSSPYQTMLALKIVLIAMMTLLAIANRYILVPLIGAHPSRTITSIRIGSIAEIALGLLAVALVAYFGMLEPV
jgi:putative copper resistance protein D